LLTSLQTATEQNIPSVEPDSSCSFLVDDQIQRLFLSAATDLRDTLVLNAILLLGNCSLVCSEMAAAIVSLRQKGNTLKGLVCCLLMQFAFLGFFLESKSTGASFPSTPLSAYLIGALNPRILCVLSK